jgi:hypothetical protein
MIERQARYASTLNLEAAERHIQQQLRTQGENMRRRGIDEDLIARELRDMERAIRGLVRLTASRGAP